MMLRSLPHMLLGGLGAGLLVLSLGACSSSSEPLGESEQPISADDDANAEAASNDDAAACDEGVAPDAAPAGFCQVTARGLCFDDAVAACACAGCASDLCAIAESFPAQAFCPAPSGSDDPDAPATDDPGAPVSSQPNGTDGHVGGGTSPGFPGTGCGAPGQTDPSPPSAPSNPAACVDGVPQQQGNLDGCDFVVAGLCFADGDQACACAGCADGCGVLESYPAQVRCQ